MEIKCYCGHTTYCDCDPLIDLTKHNYVLVRENDNKQITASTIRFIEWDENGVGKKTHNEPAVGRSIIVNPSGFGNYKWLTSVITEVVSENEFKTENSIYKLYEL